MGKNFRFTSESVTEGHPDKICDQISDAVLDALLEQDKNSRVACETSIKDGGIRVIGEITTDGYVEIPDITRGVIRRIGYDNADYGLDYNCCSVSVEISRQSADIAKGVNGNKEQGAGDQGMMIGYANKYTKEYMPMPIMLAHGLTKRLAKARKDGILLFLRPDGKSQVTVKYENKKPVGVENITIAAQHDDINIKEVREGIIEEVVKKEIPGYLLEGKNIADICCINGTGRFIIGGPKGDAGLTGRKIIVDTYGGFARHGGGAFSGKDPSKVDRSAAYMARHIAKNIVATDLADECEIQLAYSIGVAEPENVNIETFGTGKIPDEKLEEIVRELFPLKPAGIIDYLQLKNPIYLPTASYGHFGREPYAENGYEFFTWEKTDRIEDLREAAKI